MEATAPDRRAWARYEARLQRVITHVHAHLDEPLDLNALADVAHLSPHHWHRVYHAMTGETLAGTVKRLRPQREPGCRTPVSTSPTHRSSRTT
jgi:AraC family transcriptional regulator